MKSNLHKLFQTCLKTGISVHPRVVLAPGKPPTRHIATTAAANLWIPLCWRNAGACLNSGARKRVPQDELTVSRKLRASIQGRDVVEPWMFAFLPARSMSHQKMECNTGEVDTSSSPGDEGKKKKVAIFDKDGTLTCMHAMWAPWLIDTAGRLEAETGMPLRDDLYHGLGFDVDTRKFGPGLLMEDTQEACVHHVAMLLEKKGLPHDQAQGVARRCFVDENASLIGELLAFGDVRSIFTRLREAGYHVAVNSSDSRVTVAGTLERLGVDHLVDVVICGDDEGVTPKPDPSTILDICRRLGVKTSDAVFIGDTPTDAQCGRNSKCGLVIGVLTGGVDPALLNGQVDHLVDNIEAATDIILNRKS